MLTVLFLTLGLAQGALAGRQDPPSDVLQCWDGSFAYTQVALGTPEHASHLIRGRLYSQEQEFVQPLVQGPVANWGQAEISFYFAKSECEISQENPQVMTCKSSRGGYLVVAYDEDSETRHIKKLPIGELELKTRVMGKDLNKHLMISLAFVRKGTKTEVPVGLMFPISNADGRCRHF